MTLIDALMGGASALAFFPILGGPGVNQTAAGYQIARSLRFRSGANANLNRTFSAAPTTRTKCHVHFDTKRGTFGADSGIFATYDGFSAAAQSAIYFNSSNQLRIVFGGASAFDIITSRVFRDPNAHYIIDIQFDTTQATNSDRIKLWVNGVRETSFGTTNWPNLNAVHQFTYNGAANRIGSDYNNALYYDGLISNFYFIDGIVCTASDFGLDDPITGVWARKEYVGSFGANGFFLDFADNSASSAAAIGADRSGNGNNWTPNNISVTAGVTNDSLTDTPTNYGTDTGAGGEVRGNYCVINLLTKGANLTVSDANLTSSAGASHGSALCTMALPDVGTWYWEWTSASTTGNVGAGREDFNNASYVGATLASWGYAGNGSVYNNSSATAGNATYTTADVIGLKWTAATRVLTFYKGTSVQPITVTLPAGSSYFPATGNALAAGSFNFGQKPWVNAANASGAKALCTQNLPDPAIKKPSDYFNAVIWAGGSTASARSITGVGHSPDMIWGKGRSVTGLMQVYDTARGANKRIQPDALAEATSPANGWISSFDTDGFSTTPGSTDNSWWNGASFVSWCWKKGALPGLDIITYAGVYTSAGSTTVGHSLLGAAPEVIISKSRNVFGGDGGIWTVRSKHLASPNHYLSLNTSAAAASNAANGSMNAPTSSTIDINWTSGIGISGNNYIAYLFREISGFSKFGTYVGTGSTDGQFVHCGFRPRFVLMKRTDSTSSWYLLDTTRSPINVSVATLYADATSVEDTSTGAQIDFLSNGFKHRNTGMNVSGGTYIFMAFAETPFKYARAR